MSETSQKMDIVALVQILNDVVSVSLSPFSLLKKQLWINSKADSVLQLCNGSQCGEEGEFLFNLGKLHLSINLCGEVDG